MKKCRGFVSENGRLERHQYCPLEPRRKCCIDVKERHIEGSERFENRAFANSEVKTTGEMISDEDIEKVLVSIYENENCNELEYYIKALGNKKLSKVLRKRYGIIVNHKKIYRMRKDLGLLRKYKKHTKHAGKRPKNHEVSEQNRYWEADIKFIPTIQVEGDGSIHFSFTKK